MPQASATAPLVQPLPGGPVAWSRVLLIATAYFLTGKIGLEIAMAGSLVTLVWMPTGIAVAALYHWGSRYWVGVWLGALAVNIATGSGIGLAALISIGNVLGPLLGAALLRRWHFAPQITSGRDVLVLTVWGAMASALLSSSNGAVALLLSGRIGPHDFGWTWLTWWLGDAVGVVLCGMALITFSRAEVLRLTTDPERNALFLSGVGILLIGAAWMLAPINPVVQILLCTFPVAFVIWIALQLGPWPAASAALGLAVLGAWAVSLDRGPFADPQMYLAITKFWAYMTTLSVVALLVSALNSERTRAHQNLVLAEERFRALTHLSSDWYWEQDSNFRFTGIFGDLQAKTGQANDVFLGKTRWDLPSTSPGPSEWAEHRALLERHEPFKDFEISRLNAEGKVMHYAVSGAPVFDARKRFVGYRGVGNNITSRRQADETIKRLAHFDMLTDLPNRALFPDRLTTEMRRAQRSGAKVALLMLDLDHFKAVNDTLGHDQGDQLLVQAAQRLRGCVRGADTVARMGGDEFMVILGDLDNLRAVETIAANILQSLNKPYELTGGIGTVSASVGIALYPDDASDVENLVKRADQAMYAAKTAGRNRFSFYTKDLQDNAESRIWMANDIRLALLNHQFWIAYQPIHSLADGSVHKAEALIRWQHPERGAIEPSAFVPVAESSGLISEIGEWVFTTVAAQAKRWRSAHHGDFQISINRSPVQFYRPSGDAVTWRQQLQDMGIGERSIVVEIAESLLLNSSQNVSQQLQAIRGDGMQVSIDDFGSGASSLSNLQEHHIDFVKIDQAFVRKLTARSNELTLSQAIIAMAHKLGIEVIAQGVETQEQHDLLKAAGCDFAQGYFFARPMNAEAFDAYLSSH